MLVQTIFLAAAVAMPVPSPKPGVPQTVTLGQAIAIAAAKSPVLSGARANYRLTQIPVSLARTAIFPNISANASVSHSTGGRNSSQQNGSGGGNLNAGGFGSGGFASKGLNVQLRQLIFDGGKAIAQIHQARADAIAGAQTYDRALETLSFNVAQAYYNTLQAQSATHVDQQVLHQSQVNEALARAQVNAGISPRIDLVTAHVPTVQAQVALIRAQGAQASALGAFANALGLDPDTLVAPANDVPANPAQTLVPVLPYNLAVACALALRPDYLASQDAVLAAQYNVQAQRAGSYPSLNGTAAYGTNSTLPNGSAFVPSSSVGATLTIPLFDQGITRAQTEQAQAQLDLANSQLQETKLGVELNVQQALVGVISGQGAVTQAQAALTSAQESLRGAQAQYRSGVTTLVSLLQAQVNFTQAESDEVNAVYTLRQAEQSYIYALGESSINPTP